MLKNLEQILASPYQNQKAVGSFNVYNYQTIMGVLEEAREKDSPVILAFGAKYLPNMNLSTVVSIIRDVEKDYGDICIHLDHCNDVDIIKQAIDSGFTSVMYDGSRLPFEENVENTSEVVKIAHKNNVSVEAELGSLGSGAFSHEGSSEDKEQYTDAESAAIFVEKTGVDALAVSIGTVHGLYKGEPNVRLDILKEINDKVDIPLVLHGGSGTPEETIHRCILNGITKINVNTEISMYVVENTKKLLEKQILHYSQLNLKQREWIKEIVGKYIDLFNGK